VYPFSGATSGFLKGLAMDAGGCDSLVKNEALGLGN